MGDLWCFVVLVMGSDDVGDVGAARGGHGLVLLGLFGFVRW
jgi:hypothetical protein